MLETEPSVPRAAARASASGELGGRATARKGWRATLWRKEALIFIAVFANLPSFAARVSQIGLHASIVAYLVLFSAIFFALLLTAQIHSQVVRWLWAAVLFVAFVFCESYRRITGDFLEYPFFVSLFGSIGFLSEALSQFSRPILISMLNGLLLLIGVVLPPRPAESSPARLPAVAPLAAIGMLMAVLYARGGGGVSGLPSPFTPLAYGALLAYEDLTEGGGVRRPIELAPSSSPVAHDIILIIDESIRGDYLDLNSPAGVYSGLKDQALGPSIYNFGLAAAATNCSIGTNISLRFGATRENHRTPEVTMPSIWQYARKAGMRSVYIDAQRTGGSLQNRMTKEELQYIDRFIQFDSAPVVQRDMEAARVLAELSRNGIAELILVNKVGAHYPIHDKYPDDFLRYTPALPRGGYTDVAYSRSIAGFNGEWELYKNAYKNTVLWSVGRFFDHLLSEVDFNQAIVLYTSDHGQSFHERGEAGLSTHCNPNPPLEEGLVPLVVITGRELKTADWRTNLPANFNHVSHYQIFPTLLTLMNYELAAVSSLYGPPLSQKVDDPFTFNARFEARFRLKPVWVKIELAQVMGPGSETGPAVPGAIAPKNSP
jgi:lipid A ethanolaminephosphotransferase